MLALRLDDIALGKIARRALRQCRERQGNDGEAREEPLGAHRLPPSRIFTARNGIATAMVPRFNRRRETWPAVGPAILSAPGSRTRPALQAAPASVRQWQHPG